jgi:hypothetical protein
MRIMSPLFTVAMVIVGAWESASAAVDATQSARALDARSAVLRYIRILPGWMLCRKTALESYARQVLFYARKFLDHAEARTTRFAGKSISVRVPGFSPFSMTSNSFSTLRLATAA